jgi:predicted ATPase/transcriptional regulator with XRE-family HTH domain
VTEQAGADFGALLRQLRADAGLTQDELAEAARVSQRAVSDLERGINRTARKDTALLLAGALGLDGPARDLFVAAARGRVPATQVLAARSDLRGSASRSNLPAPVAGFVGRTCELAELGKLAGRHRLVTIVGTGGVGKTRLAIETAAAQLEEHRDRVWFADLAGLSDPAGVTATVASAIGMRQISGRPIEQLLMERVGGMRALLVIDNCEHLVGSVAATIQQILETGPGMRVIATSRQPLRVPGERVWQAPPLCFPTATDRGEWAELASFDAVRLFIERAGLPNAAGEVAPEDLWMIATIAARLEGLPLAIELAAARAYQLGLRQLASVLQERISLSWLGSRTVHARQQTLAATIGWSYDLLTPALQSALKRLVVFSDGFTLEAAATVTGAAENAASTVASLTERSLIEVGHGAGSGQRGPAEVRYRMLEVIRQYCAERGAGEDGLAVLASARDAHGEYFAELARQASAALTGWHQGRWLTTLEADHANLITAINHLLGRPGRAGAGLQMIVDLSRFWFNRGHLAECAALLRGGLDAAGPHISAALRAGVLTLAGHATADHDLQAAGCYLTESLQVALAARDDCQAAKALEGVAYVSFHTGSPDEGIAAGRKAVKLARTVGDPVLLGDCLIACGNVADDPQECRAMFEEALTVTRRCGDRINTARAQNNLGEVLLTADDLNTARHHLEQAQAILRDVGDPTSFPLINLGWVHLRSGNPAAADTAFAEALHALELHHGRHAASYATLGLACTAAAQREWERAACLLEFADHELQDCGASWSEPERTYREQAVTNLERQLGAESDRHYNYGRNRDRSDLIDLALRRAHNPIEFPCPRIG